jgi:hypothetical protein
MPVRARFTNASPWPFASAGEAALTMSQSGVNPPVIEASTWSCHEMPRAPARGPRNAGYPSCRRPLLFGHGNRRLDPDALSAFKEPPARVTQSLTSSEVEDWDACLLLLAALGLPCALFCRGLRLRLSLLRHAALLAMSEWRYSVSAGCEHCIRITTAR